MTGDDWLANRTRPILMLRQVRTDASPRKLRLIACGCCRLLWGALYKPVIQAVEVTELHADGRLGDADYRSVSESTLAVLPDSMRCGFLDPRDLESLHSARQIASCLVHHEVRPGSQGAVKWLIEFAADCAPDENREAARIAIRRQICDVIREVIGNPFRRFQPIAGWLGGGFVQPDGLTVKLTDSVRGLAAGIHADQAFDRLPLLADALEDAGATDPQLLAHCRTGTGHVRGCWALDVVLGKE